MKKLFTSIVLLIFLVATGFSQIEENTWLLGGNLGFNSTSSKIDISGSESTNSSQIFFSPDIGYFIADQWAVGLRANIWSNSFEGDNVGSNVGGGPFVRYYHPLNDDHSSALFGHVDAMYTSIKFGPDSDALGGFSVSAGPGFAVFLNESVAVESTVLYTYSKSDIEVFSFRGGGEDSDKFISNNIAINIGFQIHFNSDN